MPTTSRQFEVLIVGLNVRVSFHLMEVSRVLNQGKQMENKNILQIYLTKKDFLYPVSL